MFTVLLRNLMLSLLALLPSSQLWSKGRYCELIWEFKEKREVKFHEEVDENTIVVEFKDTSPDELSAVERYDERLIRRVIVKDMRPLGSEVKIFLRDRDVRSTIEILDEPFRVNVVLFDKGYVHDHDPVTDLPLASIGSDNKMTSGSQAQPTVRDEPLGTRADAEPQAESKGQRRLLQPLPEAVGGTSEFAKSLDAVPAGRGKSWIGFPVYMYPTVISSYIGRKLEKTERIIRNKEEKAEVLADEGLKLFSFGNEGRALAAYQQVLHLDASIFEREPLHLWALAESNLGQGNLILADGYYLTFREKFPESPLGKFARMRQLDIKALRLLASNDWTGLNSLVLELASIDPMSNDELIGQIAIRETYWGQTGKMSMERLPPVSEAVRKKLENTQNRVESQRTAFLISSLLFNDRNDPATLWDESNGKFAAEYFKRYSSETAKPFYDGLRAGFEAKLADSLAKTSAESNFVQTITIFESLPPDLRFIRQRSPVAWAIGEAYRNLNQDENCIGFYEIAGRSSADESIRFKSHFWIALKSAQIASLLRDEKSNPTKIDTMTRKSRTSDREMWALWSKMKPEMQQTIQVEYKPFLELAISEPNMLAAPARIVLASWTAKLSTKLDANSDVSAQQAGATGSPSGSAVRLLRDLAKRFAEAGLEQERRTTINLLQKMQPKDFGDDVEARKIWSDELVGLAEDYRKDNRYLEAGRLYAYTADTSIDWEKRAEALYKGGLLLYRSGKREEAIKALTTASQDTNDLFHANLAKERLDQLTK